MTIWSQLVKKATKISNTYNRSQFTHHHHPLIMSFSRSVPNMPPCISSLSYFLILPSYIPFLIIFIYLFYQSFTWSFFLVPWDLTFFVLVLPFQFFLDVQIMLIYLSVDLLLIFLHSVRRQWPEILTCPKTSYIHTYIGRLHVSYCFLYSST